jgi:hypothetical protein
VKRIYFFLLPLILFVFSCEKRIQFPVNTYLPVLSVDASIETDNFPVVILTRSLNYFTKITPLILGASMIQNATVTIDDGTKNIKLKKYVQVTEDSLFYVFYTCDSLDVNNQIKGEEGKKYALKIIWNNKTYEATTIIPVTSKTLDSLWWFKAPSTPDTSTKIILKGQFTDPPVFGDYVRYYTKVNSEPYYPGITSAFDDLFVNGTTYDIEIPKGLNKNSTDDLLNNQFFRRGDTISVKFANIDKATYDFWRTVEFTYRTASNPFSTPVKIIGNVSNGALGYFGGYANQFKSIIIPPL